MQLWQEKGEEKMSRETAWVDITVVDDRGMAWLVSNGKKTAWIPKSQVIDSEETLERGVATKIELPIWICEQKQLV